MARGLFDDKPFLKFSGWPRRLNTPVTVWPAAFFGNEVLQLLFIGEIVLDCCNTASKDSAPANRSFPPKALTGPRLMIDLNSKLF